MKPTHWPSLRNITVFAAGTKVDPPGATFGPRRQVSYEFIWVRAGSVTTWINRRKREGAVGTLFLVPSGVTDRYDWSRKEKTIHSFIHFFSGPDPKAWPPEGPSIPLGDLPFGWPSPSSCEASWKCACPRALSASRGRDRSITSSGDRANRLSAPRATQSRSAA